MAQSAMTILTSCLDICFFGRIKVILFAKPCRFVRIKPLSMSILRIEGLTKIYGSLKAVDHLTLSFEKGKIYGILGPNGSGKTTTLGMILGILRPTSGSFTWFDGKYGEKYRMHIGAILETPNFYPYLNAEKNLEIVQSIKKSHQDDISGLLNLVDLAHRKKSKFREYSLGMKQRLAIAATLIGDPDVIIFDEPTNGLDPQGISEIRNILKQVAARGKTVILASHLLDEVEKICTDVAIIKDGKLLAQGPVGAIITDDIQLQVAAEDMELLRKAISEISFISGVHQKEGVLECMMPKNYSSATVNKLLSEKGIILIHLVARGRNLEEDFLEITKGQKTN